MPARMRQIRSGIMYVLVGGVITTLVLAGQSTAQKPKPIAGDVGGVIQALGAKQGVP